MSKTITFAQPVMGFAAVGPFLLWIEISTRNWIKEVRVDLEGRKITIMSKPPFRLQTIQIFPASDIRVEAAR